MVARHLRGRSRLLALAAALTLPLTTVVAAQAATPSDGTVSPTVPMVSWDGQDYPAGASVDPAVCLLPTDTVCDHFSLTVDVPASYWDGRTGGVEVAIAWPDAGDDFDMNVYDSSGALVGTSAQGGTTTESVFLTEASGTYSVEVNPWLVTDSGYTGTASFIAQDAVAGSDEFGGPAAYNGVRITGELPAEEPQSTPARYKGKPLVLTTQDVGREAAEPTVGVDKSGTAFFPAATFDGPGGLADTRMLRSTDGNRTWTDVTSEPVAGEDFPVTLDPYVYVDEDSGRVFDLDLYVGSAYLSYSDDQGQTWQTNPAASGDFVNDHQTLFAGPAPAGFTTTDPKFPEILYYCFNRVADSSCGRSLDGGRTFTKTGLPAYLGFDPAAGGLCGGLHGHVATDPAGRVLLPKGHCGFPWVSLSEDAGTTWKQVQVSDTVDMPDNQSSVASDAAGNLYYVWYDSRDKLPYLATSTDHGMTWSDPLMIAPPGVHEVQWPTVYAGDDGRIVVGFPGTRVNDENDDTRPWDYYVTISTNALDANPLFVSNIANPQGDPVHRGDCPGRCGNMLDFLDVTVSPADGFAWATVVDTCTDENNCRNDPDAVGFDGDSDNAASDMRGIAIRQVSGPVLLTAAAGDDCTRKKNPKGGNPC